MAKMRVYELAKEIGKESKEIIAFLKDKGIEVKSASSNVEDDVISVVKGAFGGTGKSGTSAKTEPKSSEKPADKPAPAVKPKTEPKVSDKPIEKSSENPAGATAPVKKKKNITAVFNSQYSSGRPQGQNRRPGGPGGQNAPSKSGDQRRRPEAGRGPIKPRLESERIIRPRVTPTQMPKEAPVVSSKPKTAEPEVSVSPQTKAQTPVAQETPVSQAPAAVVTPEKPAKPEKVKVDLSLVEGTKENRAAEKAAKKERVFNNNNRPAPPAPEAEQKKDGGGKGGKDNKDRKNKKRDQSNGEPVNKRRQERTINLEKAKAKKHIKQSEPKTVARGEDETLIITIPEHLTIKALCEKMMIAPSEVIKKLFLKGMMVTVNQDVSFEQAEEIAEEFNCICEMEEKVDVIAELLKEEEDVEENLVTRPPVVCVMGHVDHGKTSLLDAIRDTHMTDREAGGITQKIGAYMVSINGQKITFLDTPGHEAFTAMRMRGASSTDIAILVVAADDGVMPQTVEAINHARAAEVEIIVAINKIDKPGANIDRVKKELAEYDLVSEDWGGNTVFCEVSAKTGQGIDELLEMVILTSEVLELKADPHRNARGIVIEAELDKGRGVVTTVLVQKGTLRVGDPVAAGKAFGKVRAMIDEHGKRIKKAGPSVPVEILGLSEVPNAGEIFMEMDSEKEARSFAGTFVSVSKDKLVEDSRQKMSLDDLFTQIQAGNLKELNLIVKADVQGSVEAVRTSLEKLSNDEVVVKIIHAGVGAINESDVTLASASNAIIIGFNVRPDNIAKQSADNEGIDVRLYNVIYNIIEDIESAMKGMLEPIYEEKVIGHAVVRQIFKASEIGNIAGSYVTDGELKRNCKVRISRREDLVFEGELSSLKRFKDNVKEVKAGFECGLVFEDFHDFEVDDEIEAYIMVEVARK